MRKGGERPIDSTTIAQGHTFFVGENLKTQRVVSKHSKKDWGNADDWAKRRLG